MKALYEALASHLLNHGSDTTHSHTGGGDPILETPDEFGLMIFVEVNDQKTGHHEIVPIQDLVSKLSEGRTFPGLPDNLEAVGWDEVAMGDTVWIDNYQGGQYPKANPKLSGPFTVVKGNGCGRCLQASNGNGFMHYTNNLMKGI